MVTAHAQRWLAGGPFWSAAIDGAVAIDRPVLLKLEGDRFMDELTALLAVAEKTRPQDEGRDRRDELDDLRVADNARLFQPGHGHYTLVLASLVCALPGLPDHAVGSRDTVGFVVRRLDAADQELAWIPAPGQEGARGSWKPVVEGADLSAEEVHPLFPVMWNDAGRTRRAWAGVVPVSARERYEAAGIEAEPAPNASSPAAWKEELAARVIQPIVDLRVAFPVDADADAQEKQAQAQRRRADQELTSRLILLELAEFLERHLKPGWLEGPPAGGQELKLWQDLDKLTVPRSEGDQETKLLAAAREVLAGSGAALVGEWKGTSFNLARVRASFAGELREAMEKPLVSLLAAKVKAATDALPEPPPAGGARYVVRCVYRRRPCGVCPLELSSSRSLRFRMAGFLDLDAPHRPVRISLPDDVSPTTLRGLKKSVGIVMSAAMRAQTEAADKDTLKGNVKSVKPSQPGIAWISIWSIPIITICATILLMIIATILNMIFWWMPYLRILVPVKKSP